MMKRQNFPGGVESKERPSKDLRRIKTSLSFSSRSVGSHGWDSQLSPISPLVKDQLLDQIKKYKKELEDASSYNLQVDIKYNKLKSKLKQIQNKFHESEIERSNFEIEITDLKQVTIDLEKEAGKHLEALSLELRRERSNLRDEKEKNSNLISKTEELNRILTAKDDEICSLKMRIDQEKSMCHTLEDNLQLITVQFEQDIKTNKFEWNQSVSGYEVKIKELVDENVRLRQSVNALISELDQEKRSFEAETKKSEQMVSMKLSSLKEKHEVSSQTLRNKHISKIENLTSLYKRCNEEINILRASLSQKDAQLLGTAQELKKVAVREAVSKEQLANVESRLNRLESSFKAMKLKYEVNIVSLGEKTLALKHTQKELYQSKTQIDCLKSEFDPLIQKYVDSMSRLKSNYSKKSKEKNFELESVQVQLNLKAGEIEELREAIKERENLIMLMERKLTNMTFRNSDFIS